MASASDSRTKRLLDLVVLLLDVKQPIPFSDLREQFSEYRTVKPEAGLRAFERDKATLVELGVPIRWVGPEEGNDLPPEGGYFIDRQRYRLPEVSLSPDEVAALVVTAAAARHQPEFPYRHAAEMAVRKLMFDLAGLGKQGRLRRPVSGQSQPRQAQAQAAPSMPKDVLVHMPSTYRSRSLSDHLSTLEEAIRLHKRVTLQYDHHKQSDAPRPSRKDASLADRTDGVPLPMGTSTSEKWYVAASGGGGKEGPLLSTRDVDPYGLVYRHGAWLLVGYCHMASAVRRFRVDRILDLKVFPRPKSPDFEVPNEFSLQEHGSFSPWRFEREAKIPVTLWVSGETPWVAEEDFGPAERRHAPAVGELPEGVLVDFSCGNLDYLVTRVLSASGLLRVVEPPILRQRIMDTAAAVARRNTGFGMG